METEFTPITSLAGGALIGLSAVMLMASHGKIAGISGIVSRILPPVIHKESIAFGIIFILGLLLAVPLWNLFFVEIERQAVSDNYFILGIAGLLVGFGSLYGNGCTSGHGVCGLSRGSARSIIATVTFMFTGFFTVYILRNTLGL
ncbi:YeeE/YedE thiosulfate transporter family protein [Amylibacter sp.]|nr:YeeE/YedE thiosulfate transporter family protein [Amylibacter sp.]